MNRVLLIGNIGKTPEIRELEDKSHYAVMYLATNERWIDSKGVQQTRTDWHRIVVFREKLVDFIRDYLRQGSRIMIEGKIQNRKCLNDDGTEVTVSEVIISKKGPGYLGWMQSPFNNRESFTSSSKSADEEGESSSGGKIDRILTIGKTHGGRTHE